MFFCRGGFMPPCFLALLCYRPEQSERDSFRPTRPYSTPRSRAPPLVPWLSSPATHYYVSPQRGPSAYTRRTLLRLPSERKTLTQSSRSRCCESVENPRKWLTLCYRRRGFRGGKALLIRNSGGKFRRRQPALQQNTCVAHSIHSHVHRSSTVFPQRDLCFPRRDPPADFLGAGCRRGRASGTACSPTPANPAIC